MAGPAQRESAETPDPSADRLSWDFSGIPVHPPERREAAAAHATVSAVPAPVRILPKLTVGTANDPLEHEADRIAGEVLRMPAPMPPVRTRHETARDGVPERSGVPAPRIVREVLASPAQPLDAAARAFFEPRFGYDFSRVRVHAGGRAAESAYAVGALGYTSGDHIVLAPGHAGQRALLAHELAHVVQQAPNGRAGRASQPPVLRAPEPNPASPAAAGSNLTADQAALLQQARAKLNTAPPHIVGVLITGDGRQFEFESGGGQGFSSHIEGKAVAKMKELGIRNATLLSSMEPCQICDRSGYPAETGPSAPLVSTKTGKELTRQTPMISSSLPTGYELTVVGPDSTGIYRGTAAPRPSAGPVPPTTPPGTDPGAGPHEQGSGAAPGALEPPAPKTAVADVTPPTEAPDIEARTGTPDVMPPSEAPEVAGGSVGAVAGLGMWLNQALARANAEAEVGKAQAALDAEAINIRADRSAGSWVGVWIVVNEPAVVDLGGGIIQTPDQARTFAAVLLSQGATKGDTQVPPPFVLEDPGPNRVYRSHLVKVLTPLTAHAPASPASAAPRQGPETAADLDADIDRQVARKNWPAAAKTLNGFNTDDIGKRLTSDPRLTGLHRELMQGALNAMILWPPPNRVADAIYNADPEAARLGRIDYVDLATAAGWWKEGALALNGFSEQDIRVYLPRDVDKMRPLRQAAVAAGLDRIVRLIDERHAFIP